MSDESDILGQINAASGGGAPAAPAASGAAESPWASAIDGAIGQAAMAKGAQNVATAGSQMLAAAKSGQFSIDPAEGQAIVKGLNDEISRLNGLYPHVQRMQTTAKLGQTPAALKVAPFNMQVALTGQHAFIPNHNLAIDGLRSMVQAIQVAIGNYQQSDTSNAHNINNAQA